MDKAKLRQFIGQKREELSNIQVKRASEAVFNKVISSNILNNANVIMSYMPKGNELDIKPVNRWILDNDKVLCLPRTIENCELEAVPVMDMDKDLVKARFGLSEPKLELKPFCPENIDLILVPGVAFDRCGNRLGHGKGYYDRFLALCSKQTLLIGVAYDLQVFDEIPHEAYDKKVSGLVTEKEFILLKQNG